MKFSDGPSGGILTLRAAPGAALFLAHEKRPLCDRINAYLGRPAVTQLKFSQGAFLPPPPESLVLSSSKDAPAWTKRRATHGFLASAAALARASFDELKMRVVVAARMARQRLRQ